MSDTALVSITKADWPNLRDLSVGNSPFKTELNIIQMMGHIAVVYGNWPQLKYLKMDQVNRGESYTDWCVSGT